jgi:hypothetical protein
MSDRGKSSKDPYGEGEAAAEARRGRNLAIAAGLGAFVILIFVISILKYYGNVHAG